MVVAVVVVIVLVVVVVIGDGVDVGEVVVVGAEHFRKYIKNKFALLWGEAQLCLPYVCL